MSEECHPRPLRLVFLPATEPTDTTYGVIPKTLSFGSHSVCQSLDFGRLVWYNAAVRAEARAQISRLDPGLIVLVGFSKSGLGAWNLTRELPDRVAATLIFDAPLTRAKLPPWGTAPFYADDAAWAADRPLLQIAAFKASVPASHRLILISGANFHGEMETFSKALRTAGVAHAFLASPGRRHHWNSGWLEEALPLLSGADGGALCESGDQPTARLRRE